MASDVLLEAQKRYRGAYNAYRQAAKQVAEKLANGVLPSLEEVENEERTLEELSAARRALLDVVAFLAAPRG